MHFSAAAFKSFNKWATIVWTAMMPLAVLTGWIYSVAFVSIVSIYALAVGHLSTYQSARVEVKQDDDSG